MTSYSEPAELTTAVPQQPTFWSKFKKALGPIAIALTVIVKFFAKVKFIVLPLLKFLPLLLKSGGTMLLMIWVYAMMWGWRFGVGFVLLLLVHECGHLVVARKLGLKAGAPVFIPFMGAFIALKDAPKNAWIEALVGIGGPLLGTAGALLCHVIGQALNAPLFLTLAYFGYFLNLFNLTPVGMLDGGRIVSALSRWLWIPGFAILLWFGWKYPNFIVFLMLVASAPRVFSLFRKRTEEETRYYEVPSSRRWLMSIMYFGLIALLFSGYQLATKELEERGFPAHRRVNHTFYQ